MSESTLLERLRSSELLSTDQLSELAGLPEAANPDPKVLGKVVYQRGWLTRFQISQTAIGKGKDLFIGPYILLDRIGEGGMGQVFKARHRHMKRIVALKLMRKERLVKEDSVRRFYREVEAAAKLTHPNIVMAFDAGQAGAIHFFSMEYVEGTDLMHLVREKGPLPVAEACDFIRQAALGLQHAHEQGMVHRDIKPSNLLVTAGEDKPVVKVLDMGLARLDDSFTQERNLTREGQVLGTPDYLAPEQARDARTVDIRGDIYSLGCTLFYLLTRRAPFKAETLTEVLMKHQMEAPASLRALRPDAPEELEQLVRRMLAKKPEGRPSTPAEVAAALEPFARVEKGARTRVPAAVAVVATPSQDAETLPSMSDDDRGAVAQWVRSKPDRTRSITPEIRERKKQEKSKAPLLIAGGAGAGLLLLAMVVGLVWMLRPGKTPENQTPPDQTTQVQTPGKGAVAVPGPPKVVAPVLPGAAGEVRKLILPTGARPNAVYCSPDGARAMAVVGVEVVVLDLASGKILKTLKSTQTTVNCLAATKDWKCVLTANTDRVLRRWDVDSGTMIKAFNEKLDGMPLALAVSPDGKYALSSGGPNYDLRLFNLDTGEVKHLGGAKKSTLSLAFTGDDGNYIVASSQDHPLRVWDRKKDTLAPGGPNGLTGAVKIAPAGKNRILLGTQDGAVRLWDCEQACEIPPVMRQDNVRIICLAVSPDGARLVSGNMDRWVHIWDLNTHTLCHKIQSPDDVRAVAFSGDGKCVLIAGGKSLHVWTPDQTKKP